MATTIKLGRTLWLIPLSFAVSLMAHSGGARLRIPGFIVLFLAATATGSFLPVPAGLTAFAGHLSKILLVVALFLVGTDLTRGTLRQIRGVVVWQAVGLWLIVVPLTLAAIMLLV